MSQKVFNKYKDYCNNIISSTELDDGSDYNKTWNMCMDLLDKIKEAENLKPKVLKRERHEDDPFLFTVRLGNPLEEGWGKGNAVKDILEDVSLKWVDIEEEANPTLDYEGKKDLLENLFGGVNEERPYFNLFEITSVIYYLNDFSEAHIRWRKAFVKAMLEWLAFAIDTQLQWDEEEFKLP